MKNKVIETIVFDTEAEIKKKVIEKEADLRVNTVFEILHLI
jgi:hypothetical protein